MGSVLPCPAGRLGQLLTAVHVYEGSAISGVSAIRSLGSEQPAVAFPFQVNLHRKKKRADKDTLAGRLHTMFKRANATSGGSLEARQEDETCETTARLLGSHHLRTGGTAQASACAVRRIFASAHNQLSGHTGTGGPCELNCSAFLTNQRSISTPVHMAARQKPATCQR